MMRWQPGKWAIRTRPRFIGDPVAPLVSPGDVWVVTFPHTVDGIPRTEVRATWAAACALVARAHHERWAGA